MAGIDSTIFDVSNVFDEITASVLENNTRLVLAHSALNLLKVSIN